MFSLSGLGFLLGWLCARITAGAWSRNTTLTSSREYTDALSMMPWNISAYLMEQQHDEHLMF